MNVTVYYTCHECGADDRPLVVPAHGGESLLEWFEYIVEMIDDDHELRSCGCDIESIHDVRIPHTRE